MVPVKLWNPHCGLKSPQGGDLMLKSWHVGMALCRVKVGNRPCPNWAGYSLALTSNSFQTSKCGLYCRNWIITYSFQGLKKDLFYACALWNPPHYFVLTSLKIGAITYLLFWFVLVLLTYLSCQLILLVLLVKCCAFLHLRCLVLKLKNCRPSKNCCPSAIQAWKLSPWR